LYQRATDILGIKRGARLIPSTHNFIAADNQPFNGLGSMSGNGNIGYWASGFSRLRNDDSDVRLPIDGSQPNPFVVARGTVSSATASSLTAGSAVFSGQDFAPLPVNFRYANPTQQGTEYVVAITSGEGYKQTRRIASNDADAAARSKRAAQRDTRLRRHGQLKGAAVHGDRQIRG
jgi:hypothetical protein